MWLHLRILTAGTPRKPSTSHRPALWRPSVTIKSFSNRSLICGGPIINWAHPAIFWGFCMLRGRPQRRSSWEGSPRPGSRIPQAEQIPLLGTVVDLFAVIVLVGLIASSIRRYLLTPPGLQRTADATIVVSLIAALMVTYLMAEAGGHVKQPSTARPAMQARLGPDLAALRHAVGTRPDGRGSLRAKPSSAWASAPGGSTP